MADIDAVHGHVIRLREMADASGRISQKDVQQYMEMLPPHDRQPFWAALNWFAAGMRSVFLQDANSLVIKPDALIRILRHLSACFPWVDRITSYARAHTVARISDDNLGGIRSAGLSRIHMGLESGSDAVLVMIRKGVDKATQVKAGQKAKRAGMQLSEYVMPGLGGKALSREHALETADALNRINPDFIRLRTLAIPEGIPLEEDFRAGRFVKLGDTDTVREIRLFVDSLNGITGTIASDHVLNLLDAVKGRLPGAKTEILAVLDRFLALPDMEKCRFQVGRRMGVFTNIDDLDGPRRRARVDAVCEQYGITPENVDGMIDEMMTQFI